MSDVIKNATQYMDRSVQCRVGYCPGLSAISLTADLFSLPQFQDFIALRKSTRS